MKPILELLLLLTFFTYSVKSQDKLKEIQAKTLQQQGYDRYYNINYSTLSFHSYFDIIRQAGGGVSYTPNPTIDLDLRVYGIYPFSPASKFIFYDDYFNYNGAGSSLILKIFPNSNNQGFYFGPYASVQYMEYRSRWIPYHYKGEAEIYMWQKQSKFMFGGVPFTSMVVGLKKNYPKFDMDFFFGMGGVFCKERLVATE
ncbi:MAG TPA: hypothetical protein VGF30_16060, partial [Bacteroidia bacterium]